MAIRMYGPPFEAEAEAELEPGAECWIKRHHNGAKQK